jgi:hypothetical protein
MPLCKRFQPAGSVGVHSDTLQREELQKMRSDDKRMSTSWDLETCRRERQAREREQELKEMREDPRYIAAVSQGEQERAAREALPPQDTTAHHNCRTQ